MSLSSEGFHWMADISNGVKVVRYCFPDNREATRRMTSRDSKHIGKSTRIAEELAGERRDGYRSMAPTAMWVWFGRQWMRLASYLNAVPELRWDFQCQEMPQRLGTVPGNAKLNWRWFGVLVQTLAG